MDVSKEVKDGQAVYTRSVLSIYDLWVLGVSNSYIWKCPTRHILKHFNSHVSTNHLDVGVGTGYYLDKGTFPDRAPRIALMDLNANSLDESSKRISRYRPEAYQVNVMDRITLDIAPFDSISVNYLFHCLPGSLETKLCVLDNLSPYLNNGGVIFGSTILSSAEGASAAAKKLMAIYNKKGIFSNADDRYEALESYLSAHYEHYELQRIGCVVLFSVRGRLAG